MSEYKGLVGEHDHSVFFNDRDPPSGGMNLISGSNLFDVLIGTGTTKYFDEKTDYELIFSKKPPMQMSFLSRNKL